MGNIGPSFDYEQKLWDGGLQHIGGIDEVGRGAFAGSVVSGVVGFSLGTVIPSKVVIKDSKKMTQNSRETSNVWIKRNCLFYGIGTASVRIINSMGITKATQLANRRAIINARRTIPNIDHLLSDAFYIPRISGIPRINQTPIVKGDNVSISIAAASIIAKVHRDNLMSILHNIGDYNYYHWHKNKGYGTKTHREALEKYGVTSHHRTQFVKNHV